MKKNHSPFPAKIQRNSPSQERKVEKEKKKSFQRFQFLRTLHALWKKKEKERNTIVSIPEAKQAQTVRRACDRSSSIDPPRIYLPPRRFLRLTGCIGRGIEPRRMAFVARLGLSLSRTRWSLLHHTPNAHVHCPSSQQGSSIPIGRKPSQPPRPSGLLYIVAHLYSSRRGTGTGRTLPPERRTTSLSLSLLSTSSTTCAFP